MSAYALLHVEEEEEKDACSYSPITIYCIQNPASSSLDSNETNSEGSVANRRSCSINQAISPKSVRKDIHNELGIYHRSHSSRMCEVEATVCSADVDTKQLLVHLYGSRKQRGSEAYAVQFKLTIDNSGRTYTCMRSMIRFIELRDRLLKEIKQKRWSENIQIPELPMIGSEIICSKSISSKDLLGNPPVSTPQDTSEQTFGGWGFSMMQRFVFSQVKSMNEWLTQICSIMPTSPSLLTFLWESPTSELGTIYEVDENEK